MDRDKKKKEIEQMTDREFRIIKQKTILGMMAEDQFSFTHASLIISKACNRCLNGLVYCYSGTRNGYSRYGDRYKASKSRCTYCDEDEEN